MSGKTTQTEVPSPEDLLARAAAMIPTLAQRAPQAMRQRSLPEETIAEMKEAGFFKVLQPKRWGGYEMDPSVFVAIELCLGQGCVSTAWIYGVQAAQPFLLAQFDDQMAQDIWGKQDTSLACSTLQPTDKVTLVDGGFRISGRWSYLSGIHHSDWVGVGGILPSDASAPGELRIFFMPKSECEVIDTWFVNGLRGTGSNDVAANDVFVPEHRTLPFSKALTGTGPGSAVNTAPLFKIPFGQIFFHGVTNAAIGGLRGMFQDFLKHGSSRVSVSGLKTTDDPVAQLLCAETASALDEIELVLYRNFRHLMTCAQRGEMASDDDRRKFKFQAALSVERCSLLAARLFKASGSRAIFEKLPFARMAVDIAAARQHAASQYEAAGRNWGAPMLGATPKPDFLF